MTATDDIINGCNPRQTGTPAYNSGFKKLGVQWLIEHSTSHQHLWWLDSFVLRNPQLLKPAKRNEIPSGFRYIASELCEVRSPSGLRTSASFAKAKTLRKARCRYGQG